MTAEPVGVPLKQALQAASATLRNSQLLDADIDARLEADLLLCHVLHKPRSWLFAFPEQPLTTAQQQAFDSLVTQRAAGQPISYLTGQREFWGLSLAVDEHTLIPRPETELIVETALAFGPSGPANVLDLGTGSGAIAVALASERPAWQLTATDISQATLDIARRNSQQHNVSINFIASDWFAALPLATYQLIISNPPYIEAADPHLARGDLRFEPRSALAAGADGLDAIRQIIEQAPGYLDRQGYLLLEHGFNQDDLVRELLKKRGFSQVETRNDLAGQPRVTLGQWQK